MPTQWADALFRGTWFLPNGGVFNCDDEDMGYYHARAKEIISSGYPVPVCLEHQPTVGMSSSDRHAEQTKHTVGHCHDVRIGKAGQLQFLIDGDEKAFDIFRRNKFFSPEIRQNVIDSRTGRRWDGPSIVHLACTPRPVQVTGKPHISLSAAGAVSLSRVAVDVSLSSAVLQSKDISLSASKGKDMPFPPKDDDDAGATDTTDMDDVTDDVSTPPPPATDEVDSSGMNEDARRIQTLSEIVKPLGIDVHVTSGMTLGDYVDHLHTAFKTHQATKGDTDVDPLLDNADNPPNPQEPELAENAPIMMSTAQLNRLKKLEAIVAKNGAKDLSSRVGALFSNGWIDDKERSRLANKIGHVKLSVSDDGSVVSNELTIEIEAYERLMNSGKAGPFKSRKPDPNKPISTALSAADDGEPESPIDDGGTEGIDMAAQIQAGEDLASLAGAPSKKR